MSIQDSTDGAYPPIKNWDSVIFTNAPHSSLLLGCKYYNKPALKASNLKHTEK